MIAEMLMWDVPRVLMVACLLLTYNKAMSQEEERLAIGRVLACDGFWAVFSNLLLGLGFRRNLRWTS